MESKLQELTGKIYREGVERARNDGREIVEQAKAEAESLLARARLDAETMRAEARRDAETTKARVLSDLAQASAQSVAALRQEIAGLLSRSVLAGPTRAAFDDKDFLRSLIREIVTNWARSNAVDCASTDVADGASTAGAANRGLALTLPEKRRADLESFFASEAGAALDKGLTVNFDGKFDSGFRIGPADGSYVLSFNDKDFLAFFQGYLKEKTRALLFPKA